MTATRSAAPLLVAFAVSLLLHAGALAALIAGWGRDPVADLAYSVELVVVSAPADGEGEAEDRASAATTPGDPAPAASAAPAPAEPTLATEPPPPEPVPALAPAPLAAAEPEPRPERAAAPAPTAAPRPPAPPAQPAAPAAQPRPAPRAPPQAARSPVILDPGVAAGEGERDRPSASSASFAVLHGPIPPYPPLARSRGQEGRVVLTVGIALDGHPYRVAVSQSSGAAILDQAAVDTVRTWRFSNASGRPIEVSVPIVFELRAGSTARRD